jgi:soluble lytic murein transglycosylase-like protein
MRAIFFLLLTLGCTAHAQHRDTSIDCSRYTTHLCDVFDPEFIAAQQLFGLPAELFKAIAWTESRCKRRARSPVGAMGIMQIMPGTWATLRRFTDSENPWDPSDSIVTGALYFTQLVHRYGGPNSASAWMHAAVAYNGGPGAVPSPPSHTAGDWDKFSDASSHYADQVLSAFLCLGGPRPTQL